MTDKLIPSSISSDSLRSRPDTTRIPLPPAPLVHLGRNPPPIYRIVYRGSWRQMDCAEKRWPCYRKCPRSSDMTCRRLYRFGGVGLAAHRIVVGEISNLLTLLGDFRLPLYVSLACADAVFDAAESFERAGSVNLVVPRTPLFPPEPLPPFPPSRGRPCPRPLPLLLSFLLFSGHRHPSSMRCRSCS